MAYLHCHSCDWSQDDFWTWKWNWKFWKFRPFGYNPISLIFDSIRDNIKPRYIWFDKQGAKYYGFKTVRVHSWSIIVHDIKRQYRNMLTMRWWTWKDWKKDQCTARCPNCGDHNFDID